MRKHRGEIVEELVRRSGFPLTRLAKTLGISRNTLYNRFRNPNLNGEFIIAVGSIIRYNFATEFPDLGTKKVEASDGVKKYLSRNTTELLVLSGKYTDLLERYNELLSILARLSNDNDLSTLRGELACFLKGKLE